MIYKTDKKITLPEIPEIIKESFSIDTVAGRDAIKDQIETDIDAYCFQQFNDGPRSHLGASKIGHECDAYNWFGFRWMAFNPMKPRYARIVNRGHLEEARVIEWLTGIGFEIKQTDVDGKQVRIVDCAGHFGGSCDGQFSLPLRYGITGLFPKSNILLEIKTASDKWYNEMIKNGGLINGKQDHWTQMCIYGAKLALKYGLYITVNKNNDDLWIQLVELDWDHGINEINKAARIIASETIPPRISNDGSFWKCRYCEMNGICHLGEAPERNCRSCAAAKPTENGQWNCRLFNQIIPEDFIAKGCEQWTSLLPILK